MVGWSETFQTWWDLARTGWTRRTAEHGLSRFNDALRISILQLYPSWSFIWTIVSTLTIREYIRWITIITGWSMPERRYQANPGLDLLDDGSYLKYLGLQRKMLSVIFMPSSIGAEIFFNNRMVPHTIFSCRNSWEGRELLLTTSAPCLSWRTSRSLIYCSQSDGY